MTGVQTCALPILITKRVHFINFPKCTLMFSNVTCHQLLSVIFAQPVAAKSIARSNKMIKLLLSSVDLLRKNHKHVRFIAINNGIDSDRQETSEFAPFLNIMKEWFVRDTSKKIKAVLKSRGSSCLLYTSYRRPGMIRIFSCMADCWQPH